MAPRKVAKKVTKAASLLKTSRSRAQRHKAIFNLFPDEYGKIFLFQGLKCPITGKRSARMCVDHDHKDGKIRGILDWQINKALAHFKDNPEWLRNAADYLDNPPAVTALGETVYGVIGSVGRMAKNRRYGPNNTKLPQPRTRIINE